MLLIVMLSVAIAAVLIVFTRRDAISLLMLGMCASLLIMFSGVFTYVAKMGGYSDSQVLLLFVALPLQRWLQFLPIPLGVLGYIVAVGRTLFPYFFFLLSMNTSNLPWVRRYQKRIRLCVSVPTVVCLVVYIPEVFRTLVGRKINVLIALKETVLCWIVLCLLLGILILLQEYFSISSPYFKRNMRFICVAMISIAVIYGMYAIQDPGQIYNFYISEYISITSLHYLKAAFSGKFSWLVMIACSSIFVVLGTVSMVEYSRIGYTKEQEDIRLDRKFDTASMGASVFVHSIKNQLLSARVLHKKLQQELDGDADPERLRQYIGALRDMNETMLGRMEELYRSVKVSYISLVPVTTESIVGQSVERMKQKYPDAKVLVKQEINTLILADQTHLKEAFYNLLTNAWEATLAAHRQEECAVEFRVWGERMWVAFEVKDCGTGMSRQEQKKIFDPFYTSKNTNFNWGMGLYYVRKIVKSHLGHMQIRSTEGKGTAFLILVPRYEAAQKSNKKAQEVGRI